jgi:hypothetical protein
MDGPSVGRMTNDQADHRFAAVPVTKQIPRTEEPNSKQVGLAPWCFFHSDLFVIWCLVLGASIPEPGLVPAVWL